MKVLLVVLCGLAAALTAAKPALGQQTDSVTAHPTWSERVSVSAHVAAFRSAGGSDVFSLLDRELSPGARALDPTLIGGEIRVRVLPRWSVLLGAESGQRSVASVSRAAPVPDSGPVRQRTTLDVASLPYVGVEWHAFRWAGARNAERDDAADHLRLVLGVGGGLSRYRLRQWGSFVDAERAVEFEGDFKSSGRGTFGFASAGLEAPLHHWLALRGELRRQFGSAPMVADYAEFDRIDLGGTRFGISVQIH